MMLGKVDISNEKLMYHSQVDNDLESRTKCM